MKVYKQSFSLIGDDSGDFVKHQVKIKIANITQTESTKVFRSFLVKEGLKEYINTVKVPREKGQHLITLALHGVPIKCNFALWKASKDTEKGKADFFIGQSNVKNYTLDDLKYSTLLKYTNAKGKKVSRVFHTEVPWFCLIVTNRSIREGMDIGEQDFVNYMLIPIEHLINQVNIAGKGDWVIRQADRKKFDFVKMYPKFLKFSENYGGDNAIYL